MKRLLLAGATALALAACATKEEKVAPAAPVAPPTPVAASPVAPPAPVTPPTPAAPAPSPRTDYAKAENWLCKPGLANNPCEVNIDATIIKADGSTTVEKFKGDPNAPIDCFYIYPTVSLDPFTQSDLVPGPEEFSVVKSQLARFGSKCKIYAPMYRQFSLGALRARMSGGGAVPTRGTPADANNDVDDAWAYYLANENKGRGVVILGHSQGSGQITRLIAAKVDGQPVQSQLVSAIIMGTSMTVPAGKDVGGTFKSIPTCKKADQTGCAISFSSFRDNIPPGPAALFGAARAGQDAVCTNPAALGGGKATAPKAYLSTGDKDWTPGKKIETPFVMVPGLLTTECVTTKVESPATNQPTSHTVLQVHINRAAGDKRTVDPLTDVMAAGKPDPNWGLHLVDANLGMGDLVDIVGKQAAAYKKAHP